MATIYRAIFSDGRPDLLSTSRGLFQDWLRSKGIEAELPDNGSLTVGEGKTVGATEVADGGTQALRLRLDEEKRPERWTTVLTVIEASGQQWVWIDLERVSDDAYGTPPRLAPPRLVRDFVSNGTATVGPTALHSDARRVGEDDVDLLVGELVDPDRSIPVVVVSRDMGDAGAAEERADAVSSVLQGVASVWALTDLATSALSKALGNDLHVFAGAVRTYYPGLAIPDRYPSRHRFARRELFDPPRRGAQILGRAIILKAVGMRPPIIYRTEVAKMAGFARHSDDGEALLADLIEMEAERDRLRDDLEFAQLEIAEESQRADELEARERWLTRRLAEQGEYAAGEDTPPAELDSVVSGCLDALERGRSLKRVVIGDTSDTAAELDQHPKARTWGRKAWMALEALQGYAEATASAGFTGNFMSYCANPPTGGMVIATEWVATGESETTDNNPRFRQARTFPVPASVAAAGDVYMPEHVRLEKGSDPAPRLHFYDDTATGGKIYVGYLGRHLPNLSTN